MFQTQFSIVLLSIGLLFCSSAGAQYQPDPPTDEENGPTILGHNGLKYRVIRDWAKVDRDEAPVINSHAMVAGSDGLFYLITDHPENAVLVFKPDGTFVKAIGKGLQGGHGIDVINDGNQELLIHVDCGWDFSAEGEPTRAYGSVNLLTKDGELVRTFPSPTELGLEKEGSFYGPCDVAVTPENDILVIDGYGSDRVMQFNLKGELVRHWGGHKVGAPDHISNGHGISIDNANPEKPIVWVSSRNEHKLKRFTLDGTYIDTLALPGAFAGQAVFDGDHIYTGVCWSQDRETKKRNQRSGFVVVLDRKTLQVISAPGGSTPTYDDREKLQRMWQEHQTFRHVHDLMVDSEGNIYVMEWNAGCRYPTKLELIRDKG